MTKRNFKRLAALLVSSTMIVGSCLTAFAAETPGVSEGTGTYEGGEMQYPTLSVTLPTIPAGTYSYIADPNGLIAATSAAAHADSTFSGSTGIFFLTTPKTDAEGSKNIYTSNSAAQTITNQNAQDIDVTVKLEQKTAGAESIAYADSATFENTDKDKKLYLAITDGAAQNPKTAALTSEAAATITTKVEGKKSNYEAGWTQAGGYKYKLKTPGENDPALTWNSVSYELTGALNTYATWEDGLTFPAIKVTWTYGEHSDIPAKSSAASIVVPESGSATVAITVGQDGAVPTSLTTTWFSGNLLQSTNGWGASYDADTKVLTFDTGISKDFREEKADALNATYTITFTPSEGDAYTQTLTFAD